MPILQDWDPFHLAEQMTDENCVIVALLHDVMEDTDYTVDDLRAMGFSEDVLEALLLMTHKDDTPYRDYIKKLKDNPIAKTVKLADLRHNSDLSRLETVTEKDVQRVEKYKKAVELLEKEDWDPEKQTSYIFTSREKWWKKRTEAPAEP